MKKFVVSARKYRPDSFESLIGQENIATTLSNSIIRNQLANAYLFSGPRGVGKTTTARIFAKSINCLNREESSAEPCGVCESCSSFNEGRSFSIHELDAASHSGVDHIRQLNELVQIRPKVGQYSLYILDEVHMLSSAAFNAFLKTLEEPPAHAIFILATTEKHKVLPTILSRCQTYDFKRIEVADMVSNLEEIAKKEGITAELEAIHVIAEKADGSMRDALTIFDQAVAFGGDNITYLQITTTLNVVDHHYYLDMVNHFLEGESAKVLLIFDEIVGKGYNMLHFLGGLSSHLRELFVVKSRETEHLGNLPPSLIEEYRKQGKATSLKFLFEALKVTSNCEASYKSSGNPRLHIELALLTLSFLNGKIEERDKKRAEAKADKPAAEAPAVKPAADTPAAKPAETKPAAEAPAAKPAATKPVTETPANKPTATKPVAETPAAKPAAKAPAETPSTSRGFSIKAEMERVTESQNAERKEEKKELGKDSFDQAKLKKAWASMVEEERKLPRLAAAIANGDPKIEGESTIIFTVENEVQKEWIEKNCELRLTHFLKEELNNSEVELEVKVAQDLDSPSKKKIYMPEEKAKYLAEKHPQVEKLKQDLKLEIK